MSRGILDLDGFWLCWFGGFGGGFCRLGLGLGLCLDVGGNIILGLGLDRRGLDRNEVTRDAFDWGDGLVFGGRVFGGRGLSGCVGGFGNRLGDGGGVRDRGGVGCGLGFGSVCGGLVGLL